MMLTGTDLKNNLYQAAVDHLHLTLLLDSIQFGIDYLSNPVLDPGRVRPDIKILLHEIPVGVIYNIVQRVRHCYKKKKHNLSLCLLVVGTVDNCGLTGKNLGLQFHLGSPAYNIL